MVDMKTETPDTSATDTALLIGADSQSAEKPSIFPIADVISGARIAKGFRYAFDASFQTDSLAHHASPRVGMVYFYAYWNNVRQAASAGMARCIAVSGDANPVGTVWRASGGTQVGMILTGVNGATYHLLPFNESYSLAAYGVDTSGVNSGQKTAIESVVAEAFSRNGVVRGGGIIAVNQPLIFSQAFVDLTNVKLLARETFTGSIATAGGPAVSSAVGTPIDQRFQVEGYDDAGNNTFVFDEATSSFSFRVPKNAIGVTVDNLNTGASRVTARAFRTGFGIVAKGNTEKTTIEGYVNDTEVGYIESQAEIPIQAVARGTTTTITTKRKHPFVDGDSVVFTDLGGITNLNGQRYTVSSVPDRNTFVINLNSSAMPDYTSGGYVCEKRASNSSPDSNRVIINMQRVFQAFMTGGDSTGFYDFVVESRRDPGWWIPAGYNPAILIPLPLGEIKSGKNPCIDIKLRGNDGRLGLYVDRDSMQYPNDKVTLYVTANDDFKGTVLLVDRAYDVQGETMAAETYDGQMYWQGFTPGVSWPLPPAYPCPAVQINQVRGSFNHHINLPRCANREGIRIGDVTKGLWSKNLQIPPATVIMSGPETSQGNKFDREAGLYPTNKTALVIEKLDRGRIPFKELHGKISLLAGCFAAVIEVPGEWAMRGYAVEMETGASGIIIVTTPIASTDIFTRPWLNANLRIIVCGLTDRNMAPAWWNGSAWSVASDYGAEEIRDLVAGFLVQGSGITITHDDDDNELVITSTSAPAEWDGVLDTEYTTTTPTKPALGVELFARKRAGRSRLATNSKNANVSESIQAFLGAKKTRMWQANGNGSTVGVSALYTSIGGTATTRNVANTNDFTMFSRLGYVASSAAINQIYGVRHGQLQFARANAAGGKNAGFEYVARWGMAVVDGTNGAIAVGMFANASALTAGNEPSTQLNCVFIGKETGDANLSIFCNDGSGTCTKTDLGASFPANTANTDMYETRVYCEPNGDGIYWSCHNLITGALAEGKLTSDIPDATTLMAPQIWGSTRTSTVALGMDIVSQYMETDY